MSRTIHKPSRVPNGPNKQNHKKDAKRKARATSHKLLRDALTDPDSYSYTLKRRSIYQQFYW